MDCEGGRLCIVADDDRCAMTMLPKSPHCTVDEIGGLLRFICPHRRDWSQVISLSIMSVPFVGVLLFGIGNVLFGPAILLSRIPVEDLVESCLGTVFFVAILGAIALELLWQLIGEEVFDISNEHIIIRHKILGLGIDRKFHAVEVNGLFVSRVKPSNWSFDRNPTGSFSFKQGKIAFNCGRTIWSGVKTFRFGTSLDEEEARQVVSLIHKKFPQYIYKNQ